jgi:inositol oxygenase
VNFVDEPQWAVVGDTFVIGCKWSDNIVYRSESFEGNPDGDDAKYNTKYGMYEPNTGLDNLILSWGHDEYMYRFLKHNKSKLPKQALDIIRFHSFYPWHSSNDYHHLMKPEDEETKKWVLAFK